MRFGVIGTGVIGRLRAQSIMRHPECHSIGVADPDDNASAQAAEGESCCHVQNLR